MSAAVHRHDHSEVICIEEEGLLCLPSHNVLDEAKHSNAYLRNRHQKLQQHQGHHRRSPREPWLHSQYSKSTARSSYQKARHATGGPGMQAIFLCSSEQKSCGTGVFLPQRAGTKPTKKPAACPVLLPARVVQALNLKVHTLGLQISPPTPLCSNESTTKKKNDQKVDLSPSSSPDIFLPKEWTY